MRTLVFVLTALLAAAMAGERERYVMPTRKQVSVYENRTRRPYEQALYRVGPDERLVVLAGEGRYLKVKDANDRTGWVEKRLVRPVAASARMLFEDATVLGYLGNPTPIYIIDIDQSGETALRLDRSFSDELAVNLDRETAERSVQ